MNIISLLFSFFLIAAGLAISAKAEDYNKSGAGMRKTNADSRTSMERMKNDCRMDVGGVRGDCKMMGHNNMTGRVDRIDHIKGTLMLKNSVSNLMLHFPPAALKSIRNGDTITVYLGFTKENEPD